MQADAGAQVVQIFDSWASHLSPQDFDVFSGPYIRKVRKQWFMLVTRLCANAGAAVACCTTQLHWQCMQGTAAAVACMPQQPPAQVWSMCLGCASWQHTAAYCSFCQLVNIKQPAANIRRSVFAATALQVIDSVKKTHPSLPIILYISGSGGLLERMAAANPDIISIDQSVDIVDGIKRVGSGFAIQVSWLHGTCGSTCGGSHVGLVCCMQGRCSLVPCMCGTRHSSA